MIQLWSVPTANGQKVHIALEEAGLAYSATMIDLPKGEHRTPEFLALNPFGKAPVMRDPDGPGGREILLAETLAIAWYAAEKAGNELVAEDPALRAEQLMWASAISSSVAMPFAMQFFATQLAPTPDPWLIETMKGGARGALAVFDARLAEQYGLRLRRRVQRRGLPAVPSSGDVCEAAEGLARSLPGAAGLA